ncbi:RagB/SusD family nutrient uptake outer membrane protein [Phocaeicola vulgatus]|nr:RagB/SusD family nutrient uptake outer membrane protein [Phocaeicola vulgatus]MCS2703239.1 RagB/SusD family nutrient uptake outer membrane protein [Phocaeicola vulgatus]
MIILTTVLQVIVVRPLISKKLYAVISGANEVISGLKEQADSSDESVEKMLGQSYTIRAYCYFWLINMYQQPYEWNKDKLGILFILNLKPN